MSDSIKVLLPKLGESILSATVVQWFKKVGDPVRLDEPLLEVSTDKINSEIPSPAAGVLLEICAQPDQELQVGALVAVIGSKEAVNTPAAEQNLSAPSASLSQQDVEDPQSQRTVFSPAFLRIARENGIPLSEVDKIPGTGMGGRVTKNDLEAYISKRSSCSSPRSCCPPASQAASIEVERLKMSGMRKAIADNMVRSFYEAPHATLVAEVDVTAPLKWIEREKERFLAEHGCKITITTFVAQALVRALEAFPLINSSLEGDTILVKRFVNLGIAVSVNQGLLVPVIKQAQQMDLAQLARAIGEISSKARAGKLTASDVTEGTITITNFGMSGVQIGVPIIRYPEVAIVGVGAICKKVVPLEGDLLAVRSMMHVSLTFDHRVLDGMYGCGFLGALKESLERA